MGKGTLAGGRAGVRAVGWPCLRVCLVCRYLGVRSEMQYKQMARLAVGKLWRRG